MVLAAGLGTRLQPLTYVRAKPAIPLAGEPLIRRIVAGLARHRVSRVVVNLHHRPETVAGVLGDGSDLGVAVRYSWEGSTILGSAGGPRLALPLLEADTFVLLNGDTLTDIDLDGLESSHVASHALVTMALVPNIDPLRYGGVRVDAEGRVLGFAPRGPSAVGSLHFTGVQIVSAEVFRTLPEGQPAATVGELYDRWLAERPGCIHGWPSAARFWDIGTVPDYWRSSQLLGGGADGHTRGRRTHVDPSARVRGTTLWDDVVIESGCSLEDCIVTDGVRVPAGTDARRLIFWRQGDALMKTTFEAVGIPEEPTRDGPELQR